MLGGLQLAGPSLALRAGVSLVAVLTVVAIGTRSAAAGKRACYPRGAQGLSASQDVRIYRLKGVAYGCWRESGRRTRLDGGGFMAGEPFKLAGRFVAYRSIPTDDDAEQARNGLTVCDVRAGGPVLGAGTLSVVDFELTRGGQVIFIEGEVGGVYSVTRSGGRPRQVDSDAGIDPTSLRLDGATATWTRDGEQRQTTITGQAPSADPRENCN